MDHFGFEQASKFCNTNNSFVHFLFSHKWNDNREILYTNGMTIGTYYTISNVSYT